MKCFYRITAAAAVILGLAVPGFGQDKAKAKDAAIAADLEKAMTPGEGQKKLDFMAGTFDVKFRTWTDAGRCSDRRRRRDGRPRGSSADATSR